MTANKQFFKSGLRRTRKIFSFPVHRPGENLFRRQPDAKFFFVHHCRLAIIFVELETFVYFFAHSIFLLKHLVCGDFIALPFIKQNVYILFVEIECLYVLTNLIEKKTIFVTISSPFDLRRLRNHLFFSINYSSYKSLLPAMWRVNWCLYLFDLFLC